MTPAYSDPIPTLESILAEAGQLREGDLARLATKVCDAYRIDDGPISLRLVRLAWRGGRRRTQLPPFSETALLELCVFACDCHGIAADSDLTFRLGALFGRGVR